MNLFSRFSLVRCLFLALFFSLFSSHLSFAQPTPAPSPAATTSAANAAATSAPVALDRGGTLAQKGQSALGLIVFVSLCFGIGQLRNRQLKPLLRTVLWGMALQFIFAILVLNTPGFFYAINEGVNALLNFSREGGKFLFGNLVDNNVPVGAPPAGAETMGPILKPTSYAATGAFFAFNVLPTIIFFSALSTLMYYLGLLQPIVRGLSIIMQRTMGTSGSETLSGVANIFLGQTEAPLFVRPFISRATNSELMAIMTGGFSNIASGVLAAYVSMLAGFEPQIAGHLLSASIISAPAALVVAKLLIPESETSETMGNTRLHVENNDANVVDSAARGAIEGLQLALNVGAMLLVFIALVAMLNAFLGLIGGLFGFPTLSLQLILGYLLAPVAWLLGVPWENCAKVGSLIGVKTVLNEFVAYLQLATSMGAAKTAGQTFLDPRSFLLAAYALCGFANFSSIAIQIGGIGSMAPQRRGDLSRLGLISMFGGAIASCMTACVVGILL
ncbi:MAG TPA: nucleoside transporter C-terminal domain-containing protein [Abditibacterium sp.]|jgi:CNT family concentrative nucleoside transporter